MSVVKSLWASIQGDPVFMRRVKRLADDLLDRDDPSPYELGWLNSVVYVSALSLWALVAGHWSAWQAARVEVAQQEEIEKNRHEPPLEDKVVEKILEKTNISRAI